MGWVLEEVWEFKKKVFMWVGRKVLSRYGFILEMDDYVISRMTIQEALDYQAYLGGPVKVGAVGGGLKITFVQIR